MKLKGRFAVAVIGAGMMFAVTGASAQEGGAPGSGPSPYRDCGIGATLFPDTHWAAVTSNVIWDLGSTALTSATASPETCNGKKVAAAKFIVETYAALVDETARGSGENLNAMLEIYGCNPASRSDIVSAIRPALSQNVAQPRYAGLSVTEKAEQYYLILDAQIHSNFAASCAV